jgi:Mlc titration factor MtfA (ptsG expression regulator)
MFGAAFCVGRLLVQRLVRWRLRKPISRALPPEWACWVESSMPLAARLSIAERGRLLVNTQELVDGRYWEGCGGLRLTEEMRVVIAAQACLLVNGLSGDPYPNVDAILVYPSTFRPRRFSWTPSADAEPEVPTLGEAWRHGVVVLSWDSVRAGARNPFDARNVVLHEFAHQLDGADGTFDGTPPLGTQSAYATWTQVVEREYAALQRSEERGQRTVLDQYGARNRAEFFAVATEAFFEKAAQLRRKHPELYAELVAFYRQDPAARLSPVGGEGPEGNAPLPGAA